ncbi:aldose 1-epimerase [Qipengyuania sphaerica]|uniref:aldose 1-epimerase n=1 Tax=Qipengyuania sphaerica TaxID=2867243 RepID=UPI001C887B96|nr:aldose 1-epimerase [Qipengyuania sphaerica]MBX7541239.1 aldose 1-epimerase [Qipengyuania sphaerica]
MSIKLACGEFELSVGPQAGGSIETAHWKGRQILDRRPGNSVLDMACFPLVPFSNRIAGSFFDFDGREVALSPNHPADTACPVLHGFGWLSPWEVTDKSESSLELSLDCNPADWPWQFASSLSYAVSPGGFTAELGITILSEDEMPVGLGFHPYFPRNKHTLFSSLHTGEWQTDENCIPMHLDQHSQAIDWWFGRPVATRKVDTVYTGREGAMVVQWPDRGIGARILPSDELTFTTVYVPEGEDYFCVEPVSHMTDAFNRERDDSGMRVLGPGESWKVSMRIEAFDF